MKKLFSLLLAAALLLTGCVRTVPVPVSTEAAPPPQTQSAEPDTAGPESVPGSELPTQAAAETPAPSSTEAPAPPTEPPTEAPTEAPAEPVDPWSLMGELSFEQGIYEDSVGNVYTYSYGLPCIRADTEGARAINADIEEIYGGEVLNAHQAMMDKTSLYMISMGYHGEVWEDILTLVISTHTNWGDDPAGIYSYEVSTGRWLSTKDILERMHITEKQFLETCRQSFRQYFIDTYAEMPADRREEYGYYEALERVDDELYLSLDLQIYPAGDGTLMVNAPIVSLAGADYYYHLLPLDFH